MILMSNLSKSINLRVIISYISGSLLDVLGNQDIKLDMMFVASLIDDLTKGMMFLHKSDLLVHGNLRSSNCVITSRWTLQVRMIFLQDLDSFGQ